MKILATLTAATLASAALASCGPPKITFRRVEINKKKDAPVVKRVPGQRRQGFKVVAFALVGDELKRLTDPGPNAIKANDHYASIAIEEVHIFGGGLQTPLALTLKAGGILPGGADFTAILANAKKPEDDGYFAWRKPVIVNPFVYRGTPVTVEVALTLVSQGLAGQIDKAKEEWGSTRQVDPNDYKQHPLDVAKLEDEGSEILRAAFATLAEGASLPLAAGQYVVFSHPDADGIAAKVTWDREKGVVWKEDKEAVKGVSYVSFWLNRRFRGPRKMDSIMDMTRRTIDGAISGGNLDNARSALARWPDIIDQDKQITNLEKALFKDIAKLFGLRIERKAAKDAKDKATLGTKTDELVAFIDTLKKTHKEVLLPAEVGELDTRVRRWKFEKDL